MRQTGLQIIVHLVFSPHKTARRGKCLATAGLPHDGNKKAPPPPAAIKAVGSGGKRVDVR
nr:MAG TPA: hypothetical protein [Caudoviricetes sp.]